MFDRERVIHLLEMRIKRVGGVTKWCSRYGINTGFLHNVLRGTRSPSSTILDVMGMEKVVAYRYKQKPGRKRKMPEGKYGTIYGEADE